MATYEVFTSAHKAALKAQKLPYSPVCQPTHTWTHSHSWCQQSKQRECSQLRWTCIGCQAYRQTQWPSIQTVNTLFFVSALVSEHRVGSMPRDHGSQLIDVSPPLVPPGFPAPRHHRWNPHPGLCARAQERQRRPDGRTPQDPHLVGL